MIFPNKFDVIVIGGGHAGTEAALASARMGINTLLITHNIETLGQMSCNPSIGGIGKGHLVKEIDALGGAMALAADESGIQFRILNSSKGPAVRATRAQVDRILYKAAIRKKLENQNNLRIFQQEVTDIKIVNNAVVGVKTAIGIIFKCKAVVLTAGTFLEGKIHVGMDNYLGGRAGDLPSIPLALRLKELQLPQGRLKTGTPPRIDGNTIDFSKCVEQTGDGILNESENPVPVFSFLGKQSMHPTQKSCWITKTNLDTHNIIRTGFDRSPMFTGVIEGIGPRYCPSIEDKINRFSDKNSHQIFLEPEGLTTNEFYPNGISTSLPFDIQYKLIHSIVGLEKAHILRAGYAIEYNYFDPKYLKNNFENKNINGLFFAGQINGTTGYEEAAAQGLYAGINAGLQIQNKDYFIPTRNQSYLGVMIDDLIHKGVSEPYRMFTSRAEFRLQLREDNADFRLTEIGRKLGLICDERWTKFCKKQEAVSRETQRLKSNWVNKQIFTDKDAKNLLGKPLEKEVNLFSLLKRPHIKYKTIQEIEKILLKKMPESEIKPAEFGKDLYKEIIEQLEINIKYSGYIDRQIEEVKRAENFNDMKLPKDFDYLEIKSLSFEVRQKLQSQQPESIGEAIKISGITPAAISLLLIYFKKTVKNLK